MRALLAFVCALLTTGIQAQVVGHASFPVATRWRIDGEQLLNPAGTPKMCNGVNVDIVSSLTPAQSATLGNTGTYPGNRSDADVVQSLGACVVRLSFGFLNQNDCSDPPYPPDTKKESYNPNNPTMGYLQFGPYPGGQGVDFQTVVDEVQSLSSHGIAIILVRSGGNCGYYSTSYYQAQDAAMEAYLGKLFAHTPGFMGIETLSEPHPDGPNTITAFIDDGSTSPTPSGIPGNVLTLTGVASGPGANTFIGVTNPVLGTGVAAHTVIVSTAKVNGPGWTNMLGCNGTYTGNATNATSSTTGTFCLANCPTATSCTALTPVNVASEAMSVTDGYNPQGKFDQAATGAGCTYLTAAFRTTAPDMPSFCGPAATYNFRSAAQVAPYLGAISNMGIMTNYFVQNGGTVCYEGVSGDCPSPNSNYAKQINKDANGGTQAAGPYYGYPSDPVANTATNAHPWLTDDKGDQPTSACPQPYVGESTSAPQNPAWFDSTMENCLVLARTAIGRPIILDQYGISTSTPGIGPYLTDLLTAAQTYSLPAIYWVLRGTTGSPTGGNQDACHPGDSGGQSMIYQDGTTPNFYQKDSTYAGSCAPYVWHFFDSSTATAYTVNIMGLVSGFWP